MAAEAYITPAVLRWARARENLTTETAAQRIDVKPDRFAAWENGAARPTFRQAQQLAQRLNIPFGYLFLSTPPEEDLPRPDLRTVADQPPGQASPETLMVLGDWVRPPWVRLVRRGRVRTKEADLIKVDLHSALRY